MGKDLVIFMPQTANMDRMVFDHNFQSFVRHNPDSDVVRFPEHEVKDPVLKSMMTQQRLVWRNCDLAIFDFYRQHPNYGRYLYVEWDAYCTMNVHKLLNPVRKFDVTAREVVDLNSHSTWEWFIDTAPKIPEKFKPFITGTRPMCCMSFTARALEKMAQPNPMLQMDLFSEVRVGTLAKFHGFEPAAYPLYGNAIAPDFPPVLSMIKGEGIWHKLKARYFPPSAPKPDCPLIGHWAGSQVCNGAEFELRDDGNIYRDNKAIGQWIHNDADSELVLSWIEWGMEWLEVANDMCYNGPRRIYKTRYQ